MTETHTWHISNHARPTFCNVCRETLSGKDKSKPYAFDAFNCPFVGVTSHGLSCGVCKLKAHKSCVSNVLAVCKWDTLDAVDPSCVTVESVRRRKSADVNENNNLLTDFQSDLSLRSKDVR